MPWDLTLLYGALEVILDVGVVYSVYISLEWALQDVMSSRNVTESNQDLERSRAIYTL